MQIIPIGETVVENAFRYNGWAKKAEEEDKVTDEDRVVGRLWW